MSANDYSRQLTLPNVIHKRGEAARDSTLVRLAWRARNQPQVVEG
jgi:hypothetical protein